MKRFVSFGVFFLFAIILSGCAMQWQASWPENGIDTPTADSADLLRQAQKAFAQADSEKKLRHSIESYRKVLEENPADYQALKQLSTQHILLGTAYTDNRKQKSAHFRQAMTYAELAMYSNREFRQKVDSGTKPWEAVGSLGADEVEAMFFWVTAIQYEFKESMSLPGKIINVAWLRRALQVLDRIEEVDPEFGGGAVAFAKAICYYALPKSMGGSREKGDIQMQRAVETGQGWLLPRWARGKYYYPIRGETEKAKADLEWVATRRLENFSDPYPWRIHFQENARQLLR